MHANLNTAKGGGTKTVFIKAVCATLKLQKAQQKCIVSYLPLCTEWIVITIVLSHSVCLSIGTVAKCYAIHSTGSM